MDEGTAPGVCEGRWARALDWHSRCAGVGGTVLCGGGADSRRHTRWEKSHGLARGEQWREGARRRSLQAEGARCPRGQVGRQPGCL